MNEQETMQSLLRIRELTVNDHVGFDSLPHQLVKKHIQQGFVFNILLIGETGIGKSTLICSLFNIATDVSPSSHSTDEVQLKAETYDLEEKGVNLKLTVVETVGYGDQINRNDNIRPIIDYIQSQFEKYMNEELKIKRLLLLDNDTRIHACLYFICPTGHGLKSIDLYCMKELHDKVNIIPIVAKSDSLSKTELYKFKNAIKSELEKERINIYQFPTDDEEIADTNYNTNDRIPLAVAASGDYVHMGDKAVRARIFPWGTMLVEDKEHSEFLILKNMLIVENMEDMREKTHVEHYEHYRRNRMIELGFSDLHDGSNIYQVLERKRCDLQREMRDEEENLKLKFVEKVKKFDLELKEKEKEMHLKYNKIFEHLKGEEKKIRKQREHLESEIISFRNGVKMKKGRKK